MEGLISAIWAVCKADKTRLSLLAMALGETRGWKHVSSSCGGAKYSDWLVVSVAFGTSCGATGTDNPPTTAHPHSSPTDYNWPNV